MNFFQIGYIVFSLHSNDHATSKLIVKTNLSGLFDLYINPDYNLDELDNLFDMLNPYMKTENEFLEELIVFNPSAKKFFEDLDGNDFYISKI